MRISRPAFPAYLLYPYSPNVIGPPRHRRLSITCAAEHSEAETNPQLLHAERALRSAPLHVLSSFAWAGRLSPDPFSFPPISPSLISFNGAANTMQSCQICHSRCYSSYLSSFSVLCFLSTFGRRSRYRVISTYISPLSLFRRFLHVWAIGVWFFIAPPSGLRL